MRDYQVKSIRALDRGLEVLGYLQKARTASLHDLHIATELPKSTLTRILTTLEGRGLIWQRLADGAFMASHTYLPRSPQVHDEGFLVEVAAPCLERLCQKVNWPSILAVPRLTHMEVIETNRPRSYFSHLALGPIGFRINMLRSATGRAYLAFCGEDERQAILQRLAASTDPGNHLARTPSVVEKILEETRQRGYGTRASDFGGHYEKTRRESDDHRDSIALPVWAGHEVIAAVNLTWIHKAATVDQIVKTCLPQLTQAAREISIKLETA
ncbi:MAG: helix-turn-helix domain-containing protein [Burkholderiales bacterium]|jgi:IclR family mhp operon transcriptional activator|nr:helix-turn-helix domain-containing protein [Burkholderiales bacterium]